MKFNKKTNVRRIINRPAISPQMGGSEKLGWGNGFHGAFPSPTYSMIEANYWNFQVAKYRD